MYFINVFLLSENAEYLTYKIEKESLNNLESIKGYRVLVPFINRKMIGIVISNFIKKEDFLGYNENIKYKKVAKILDLFPVLNKQSFLLIEFLKKNYHINNYQAFKFLPYKSLFRTTKEFIHNSKLNNQEYFISNLGQEILVLLYDIEVPERFKSLVKSLTNKQKELLKIFEKTRYIDNDFLKENKVYTQTINSLIKKELIKVKNNLDKKIIVSQLNYKLSEEQKNVLSIYKEKVKQKNNSKFLLDGVTGSGKTEIYLQIIENIFRKDIKSQILILVPEIGLVNPILNIIKSRFINLKIDFCHSSIPYENKFKIYLASLLGELNILIGTRSSVFFPFKNLSLIIIDEEHDLSFKERSKVCYNSKHIAFQKSKFYNIPLILGTATPSLESYFLCYKKNALYPLRLKEKINKNNKNVYHIIDMKKEIVNQNISNTLLQEIYKTLAQNKQVLLFLNRKGYASILFCNKCKFKFNCLNCDVPFTVYANDLKLVCHHCNNVEKIPVFCPKCSNFDLKTIGFGTEKVEEFLQSTFKDYNILRMDKESLKDYKDFQNALNEIYQNKVNIILGTQLITKGHDFDNIGLVGILNVDSYFFSSNIGAIENISQLILQVSGRAGRKKDSGKILIQTQYPNNIFLDELLNYDYHKLCESILEMKEYLNLPPFSYMSIFYISSLDLNISEEFSINLYEYLKKYNYLYNVEIKEVKEASFFKVNNFYRFILTIKSKSYKDLHKCIFTAKNFVVNNVKDYKEYNLQYFFDINPLEIK